MSLELIESEIKKKFEGSSNSLSGKTLPEHASNQLLYPYNNKDTGQKDENGEPIIRQEIDVRARTELPSPSGTTVLESYARYMDKVFGKGRTQLYKVNQDYEINMISKDRKSRNEFTQIAVGASLTKDDSTKEVAKVVAKQ